MSKKCSETVKNKEKVFYHCSNTIQIREIFIGKLKKNYLKG